MVLHRLLAHCPALMAVSALLGCTSADSRPQAAELVRPSEFERTGYLQTQGLRESSGAAVSRRHPGMLWTHNDSGDDPVVYLTDLTGADLGKLVLAGAEARDWEDMTLGKCPATDTDCLYIADTGDNNHRRFRARIFVVPEPDSVPLAPGTSAEARRIDVYFPDRPFNIEAIAAAPSGDLWLVSKGLADTAVFAFRVSFEQLTGDSIELKPLFRMDFNPAPAIGQLVTGAAISPDGRVFVARTYTQIFFYDMIDDTFDRRGVCWLGYREPQGEAIDFLDLNRLVLTSESETQGLAPISVVSCPM